ncbi:hypothetical protein GT347_14945 [Xylophilus rhododendri]|uniref:Flagellar motor switch protein FliN-like C-terminal domain-containing protein n=1 Tax=Xylophilus rhododendri TaxID=2697032 RepID=A0A857J7W3_9BURK|nr:FliM/FliN family flagellar motor C-terminal domain-containing protein [Xylophilus rhododendri]QHI99159.1 hypothetical protein GT347_14945 [Xylophilus rhododendri]
MPAPSEHGPATLACLRGADRAALAGGFLDATAAWSADWLPAGAPAASGVRCETGADAGFHHPARALCAWQAQQGFWWCLQDHDGRTADPLERLQARLMTLPDSPGLAAVRAPQDSIAHGLLHQAWDALCAALAGLQAAVPGLAGFRTPAEALRPWSGAAVLSADWLGGRLMLLLDMRGLPAPAAGHRPRQPAPQPVLQAAGGAALQLQVALQPLEIAIGALSALQPGDVLRSTHSLETPVQLLMQGRPCTPHGAAAVGQAFLGRLRGHRAVEILGAAPPA